MILVTFCGPRQLPLWPYYNLEVSPGDQFIWWSGLKATKILRHFGQTAVISQLKNLQSTAEGRAQVA